jgi:hypothetical protein
MDRWTGMSSGIRMPIRFLFAFGWEMGLKAKKTKRKKSRLNEKGKAKKKQVGKKGKEKEVRQ